MSPRPASPSSSHQQTLKNDSISFVRTSYHVKNRNKISIVWRKRARAREMTKNVAETFIDKNNYFKWDYDVGFTWFPSCAAWNLWQMEMILSLSPIVRSIKTSRAGRMNDVENQWDMEILLPLGSMTQKCDLNASYLLLNGSTQALTHVSYAMENLDC